MTVDIKEQAQFIADCAGDKTALNIRGGDSKSFLGREPVGRDFDATAYTGVVEYDPSELVVTVRAGTPLAELERVLAEQGQMLPFEPPHFGGSATVGGMVAAGLSGPRRAWAGSVRDYVLGVKCINGRGQVLEFGGRVMKNVAGYDASRLLAGSMGTLALILEVSFKVLPRPLSECTLQLDMGQERSIRYLSDLGVRPLPVSASCFCDDVLTLRLSGAESGVAAARDQIGGEELPAADPFWQGLREQTAAWFQQADAVLWRLSVPAASQPLDLQGGSLTEWGGAQRWLWSSGSAEMIRRVVEQVGGSATQFRNGDRGGDIFHPLAPVNSRLNRNIKQSFDPHGVFNPGRNYADS